MNLDDEGRKTGIWEEPDPHGGIISGEYVAAKGTGVRRHHFRDGSVRSECQYDNGKQTGECVWFRQGGGLLQTGAFLDGEKHGLWKRWTSASVLIDEGHFDRGVKTGTWTYYAPDGSVTKTTTHRDRISGRFRVDPASSTRSALSWLFCPTYCEKVCDGKVRAVGPVIRAFIKNPDVARVREPDTRAGAE